jgi:hypothetical protein
MSRRSAVFLALAALAALVGCQGLERTDECRAVTKVANPVLAEIDHDRTEVNGPKYRLIATKYEALANSLGQVSIRTKRLAEAVNDYQRMLHEAARDARTFAEALESKDEARITIERTTTSRTLRHENTAIARFDVACKGR